MTVGGVGVLAMGMKLGDCGIGTLRGKEWMLPKEFIVQGPFRFVRNPMSLAAVIILAGMAHDLALGQAVRQNVSAPTMADGCGALHGLTLIR
jgi:hypothetical protein